MTEAGVGPGEPVIVVGHSAGGMVAANLAAGTDPDLEVAAAVNLGGPAAQVATGDTPVLSVAHSEDFVPATAGSGVGADGRIEVERSVGALPPEEGDTVPAHALPQYQGTARMIDRDDDPRLREFRDLVTGFTGGESPADVSLWHAVRTS
jgi:pimeloyl-ACP methyl ester carboxylesterase